MPTRPTVIIADGSSTFRMYFSTLLSRMNFEVLPVDTAGDVLPLAKIVRPSLITLDPVMGDECGIAVLRRLQGDSDLSQTPVIMVAESTFAEAECRQLGCRDFLVKPVDLNHLYRALQQFQPNPAAQRQHLRAPINRRVFCRTEESGFESFAVTLSAGGVYLRMDPPLPTGTRISIDLPLGKRELMMVMGEVIYTKEQHAGVFSIPPGMAIRFDALDPSVRDRLASEVQLLLAGDIVAAQIEPMVQIT